MHVTQFTNLMAVKRISFGPNRIVHASWVTVSTIGRTGVTRQYVSCMMITDTTG